MAQTIAEIYQQIIDEKNVQPTIAGLLSDLGKETFNGVIDALNSKIKVARWNIWALITSVILWMQQVLWDKQKAEIQVIADNAMSTTDKWIVDKAFDFQFGDVLVFDPITYSLKYDALNPSKKIISQASITANSDGSSTLKVAKKSGSDLIKLSPSELDSFRAYILQLRPVGTSIQCVSRDPDTLKAHIRVWFNPQKGDDSKFQLLVKESVKNFISKLNFNGELLRMDIEKYIKNVDGIDKYEVVVLGAKPFGVSTYRDVNFSYKTVSGYMIASSENGEFEVESIPNL